MATERKKSMKKTRILVALTALILTLIMIAVAVPAVASETEPSLSIDGFNLVFGDNIYIKYAVKLNGATAASLGNNFKMLYWTAPQTSYEIGTEAHSSYTTGATTIGGKSYEVFKYTEIAAKNMTDDIYARAYVKIGENEYYSEVEKYSVLKYAYNMLGKTGNATSNENFKVLLTEMLSYGAAAQKYFEYKADTRLATDDYYQISVVGGMLSDGSTYGLYKAGETVQITAPTANADGVPFSHWADSNGNVVATTATCAITVGTANETYAPVYGTVQQFSDLEFESLGDGTCYVIGMGNCTDAKIVIPAVSPDGDIVIGIDRSAFAGEAITSVSIPNTVEEIARQAFNNCTSLADVYYDGTEEEWNNISIAAGNTTLINATLHFKAAPVETFTVTFTDYDGTVLKTETVESGKSATAPAAPTRENYTFKGWDKAFDNITSDLFVKAQYSYDAEEATIVVESTSAKPGETITVNVDIANNPGVAGAKLELTYDSKLTLISAVEGDVFTSLDYTPPYALENSCSFNWDSLDAVASADGTVLTLTFTVSESATEGDKLNVSVSYVQGDIYNTNLEDLTFDVIGGTITVK